MSARRAGAAGLALLLTHCTQHVPPHHAPAAEARSSGQAAAPARPHSRPATPNEQLVLRGLMRDTERLRGLRFQAAVEMRVEDREGMRSYVRDALVAGDIARTRRRYVALGLLPAELDVQAMLETLLQDELVGYYDPERKRLVVRADIAATLARGTRDDATLALRETLVHELVHALQDQHLGLSAQLHAARTTDEDNAYAALVEGDAQLIMLAYALEARGRSLDAALADDAGLDALVTGAPDALSQAMRSVPALVREPLLFRYREGARFAARLYLRGGVSALDDAHRSPPTSTAAVVAHTAHRAASPPAVPGHACAGELGFTQVDQDSLGSLEIGIALGGDSAAARSAIAASILADRYTVFTQADGLAAIWALQLDTPRAAERVARALAGLPPGDAERHVSQQGNRVLTTRGIQADCAAALSAQFRDGLR